MGSSKWEVRSYHPQLRTSNFSHFELKALVTSNLDLFKEETNEIG